MNPNPPESHHANSIKSTKTPQLDLNSRASFLGPIRRRGLLGAFRRRNKLPTVKLGGGSRRRRGFFLKRVIEMRSLKLKLSGMMKKMKSFCRSLGKDLFEVQGTMDAFQEAVILETAFAIPIMSLTFINTLPESTRRPTV
ncbi:OLC1v1003919C1 [Oldenlandia corymbosa var. corymbosa]|uniref:OLC1v1003919C1 n=1 Tax=Oldenlandia corymbosa var. corymbosa TaxID=529605 RepID=A0AAV1DB15_OLDCO|nr:OLC1v1003919C1 [Oldenlandia corymbosa var. corymbosa]